MTDDNQIHGIRRRLMKYITILAAMFSVQACIHAAEKDVELFPVSQGGKWGYIDKSGSLVIKPQYDMAWDFSEGLASVQVGMKRGYIDDKGAMVIATQYDLSRPFSDGLAAVYTNAQKWGNFIVFNRGSGGWMYIDRTGKPAVNPKQLITAFAGEFREGRAPVGYVVNRSPRASFVSKDGSVWTGAKIDSVYVGPYSEGLAVFQQYRGKFGFIDPAGAEVIPRNYDGAGDFSEGLAAVATPKDATSKELNWGYIDKTGKVVLEAQYQGARRFSGGLAPVKKDGKWGYIDKTGKMIVEPAYESANPFSEGLARVVAGGKHGFIDTTGKLVIETRFDCGWDFKHGLARISVGESEGYIDKTGKYVWEPKERTL